MNQRYDCIVVGAGIVGVSTALHLTMRGKKTLLIDRRDPGEETSYGNAGVLEMAHVLPFGFPPVRRWPDILRNRDPIARLDYANLHRALPWIVKFFFNSQPQPRRKIGRLIWPLVAPSVQEHQFLTQGTDAAQHWNVTGRATIYRSEDSFQYDAPYRAAAKELGAPFDVMEAQAFRSLEPDVKPAFAKAVLWPGTQRITNPSLYVKRLAKRFVQEGGTFTQTDVKRVDPFAEKWRVGTVNGVMETQDIILCLGPWSTDVVKRLGYRFPLGFKRGYHLHYAATGSATLTHTLSDAEYGYALSPMEQGYRIATGAEFADRDAPPHPQQLDLILPRARELFPLGEPVEAKPWMGSRPCFPDSLPVIGPAPRHKGLWFNFGHGHVGLTIGPSSGRLLAEMLTGQPGFCDPSPYRAGRFSC